MRQFINNISVSLHGQTKDALHKNGLGNWEYDIVAHIINAI